MSDKLREELREKCPHLSESMGAPFCNDGVVLAELAALIAAHVEARQEWSAGVCDEMALAREKNAKEYDHPMTGADMREEIALASELYTAAARIRKGPPNER